MYPVEKSEGDNRHIPSGNYKQFQITKKNMDRKKYELGGLVIISTYSNTKANWLTNYATYHD